MITKDPDEVRMWLRGRNKNNLRTCSNPHSRSVGFADISKSDYIICDIGTVVRDKRIYKFYLKIRDNDDARAESDGATIESWLGMVAF